MAGTGRTEYILVGKVTRPGGDMYYQVVGKADKKIYMIDRGTMVQAAKMGLVLNARVQTYHGVDMLRGDGVNINDLVAISPSRYEAARARGMNVSDALKAAKMKQQRVPDKR